MDPQLLFEKMLTVYAGVGKTGKPQKHEHTTLAGVALSFEDKGETSDRAVFVVLATGTKCLPEVARIRGGFAVHDSHAEVLARRTLVRWLMDEIFAMHMGKPSKVFEKGAGGLINLRQGVKFHLVVSAAPCGDCAVFAGSNPDGSGVDGHGEFVGDSGRCLGSWCELSDQTQGGAYKECKAVPVKRLRTGAKVVQSPSVLPRQESVERASQRVAAVRRKPGKGLPTSSTSCSDKILRWMHLGFQGCLLRSLLERPLYFSSLFAACASEESLRRGVWDRQPATDLDPPIISAISVQKEILDEFGLRSTNERVVGSGSCMSWWGRSSHLWKPTSRYPSSSDAEKVSSEIPKASKEFREALIGKSGYKAGCLSKPGAPAGPQFHSRISRSRIRTHFVDLVALFPNSEVYSRIFAGGSCEKHGDIGHEEFKRLVCPTYVNAWNALRGRPDSMFRMWIHKREK